MVEFAEGGLDGSSTEKIARRAGISQPYLFRLYPTKKALFIAAIQRCFAVTTEVFRAAAEGHVGIETKHAMGEAYTDLIQDNPAILRLQLQAYATSAQDAEIQSAVRTEFARLWDQVVSFGNMSEQLAQAFFAHGMLCNVAAAMGIDATQAPTDHLAARMTAEPVAMAAFALSEDSEHADTTTAPTQSVPA